MVCRFLGLDNISLFDRSTLEGLPPGTRLEQADSTAWMAMFSADMLTISLELAQYNPAYEDVSAVLCCMCVSVYYSVRVEVIAVLAHIYIFLCI